MADAAVSVGTPGQGRPASAELEVATYDGLSTEELARRLAVPRVVSYADVGSTMDAAHALAGQGAPAGTVVVADRQSAGRGRNGRSWVSEREAGVWLTVVERPPDVSGIDVLSLRLGLHAARVLDRHADGVVGLKWPNDLLLGDRKVGGVLVEARWQEGRLLWMAIGIGVNLLAAGSPVAGAALRRGTSRVAIVTDLVPALRAAASAVGALAPDEMARFADRDVARGRSCREPAVGRVEGIANTGELLVSHDGATRAYRAGSLVFEGPREDGA